jgi:hypothetical protein
VWASGHGPLLVLEGGPCPTKDRASPHSLLLLLLLFTMDPLDVVVVDVELRHGPLRTTTVPISRRMSLATEAPLRHINTVELHDNYATLGFPCNIRQITLPLDCASLTLYSSSRSNSRALLL